MRKSVWIVDGNMQYERMFLNEGWIISDNLDDADLVQFTGGADVSPRLYDKYPHPRTYSDSNRDRKEQRIFDTCIELGKPMAGICRGGQFLNVMCGGELWQDVDNHTRSHLAVDVLSGEMFTVTSTHHQMMIPTGQAQVLLVASEATRVESTEGNRVLRYTPERGADIEAVLYQRDKVFCFQPHPEFLPSDAECVRYYFNEVSKLVEGN